MSLWCFRDFSKILQDGSYPADTSRNKDVVITTKRRDLWRNYVKMTSLWRYNHVIITSCVQWVRMYSQQGHDRPELDQSMIDLTQTPRSQLPPTASPGPRLDIKTVFPSYGDSHVEDKMVVGLSYL